MFKQYLMLSLNEYNKFEKYLEPYYDTIHMRTLDDDPLTGEQIKEIVSYDGFSNCIKYNRLCELWDLPYSQAIETIKQYQTKYLRTPLYIVYDDKELFHLETGIEEFWTRFNIKEEDKR